LFLALTVWSAEAAKERKPNSKREKKREAGEEQQMLRNAI